MDDVLGKIEEYRLQSLRVGRGHYAAGESLARRQLIFGSTVIVLSTFVATALFATLSSDTSALLRGVAAAVSAVTAVISTLETFLGLSRRVEAHKAAGSQYGSVRRDLELLTLDLQGDNLSPQDAISKLKETAARLSSLADHSPHLPAKYYERQSAEFPA